MLCLAVCINGKCLQKLHRLQMACLLPNWVNGKHAAPNSHPSITFIDVRFEKGLPLCGTIQGLAKAKSKLYCEKSDLVTAKGMVHDEPNKFVQKIRSAAATK